MARRKKKPQDPKWITEARKALDEMETWDSDDPHIAARIAPFRTQNWIRKGWGMLAGLKPIAVVVLLALGGCGPGWLEDWAPLSGAHSTTYVNGRAITTYHYPAPDPLGSVHEFRPDIYRRFYGPR